MSACSETCRKATGTRFEHCKASGAVAFPLWPAESLAEFDTVLAQSTEYGRGVMSEDSSDPDSAQSFGIEQGSSLYVDPDVLGHVLLGSQFHKVVSFVVGAHSISVVDVRVRLRIHDEAVFVRFDDLRLGDPAKSNVALPVDVASRLRGRWFLTSSQAADRLGARGASQRLARVTPPALPGSVGDQRIALDTEDVHALIVQWSCHCTFGGHALGDAHRQVSGTYVLAKPSSKAKSGTVQRFASEEEIPKGWYPIPGVSNTYRCLSVEEMEERGWRLVDNVWRGTKVDEEKWDRLKAASLSDSDYPAAAMGDAEEPEDDWDEQAVS